MKTKFMPIFCCKNFQCCFGSFLCVQGKGFKSCRNLLIKGGYVESVLLPKPPALMKTKPVVAGKVSKVWHLRLLKPFTVTEEEEEVGGEGEREEEGGGEECAATPIVFEMPIDMQGYRVIDKSGPRGINNSVRHIFSFLHLIRRCHVWPNFVLCETEEMMEFCKRNVLFYCSVVYIYFSYIPVHYVSINKTLTCLAFILNSVPLSTPFLPSLALTRYSVRVGFRLTYSVPGSSPKLSSRAKTSSQFSSTKPESKRSGQQYYTFCQNLVLCYVY